MVIPPCYSDLGKAARDLFDKGFNYGFTKVDVKTTTRNGIEFTTKASSVTETGNITGSLETKYKKDQYGFTFTEKWTTDNVINSEVAIKDQLASGLKTTLCATFAPNTGKKSGVLKTAYERDNFNLNINNNLSLSAPTVEGAVVCGYEGWLAGYQFGFDASKSTLTKNNFALGYNGADFQMLFNVNDTSEFGGSIYQIVSPDLATGIQLSWTAGHSNTRFGVATKYNIDSDSSVNAKINNSGQVGIGYSRNLSSGVKLTLSSLVESTKFNEGGHKLGLGFEFNV